MLLVAQYECLMFHAAPKDITKRNAKWQKCHRFVNREATLNFEDDPLKYFTLSQKIVH